MKIRRKVLNMSSDMWKKLDIFYNLKDLPSDDVMFKTTPKEFLEKIGLPGALSAYCNEEEDEFFKQIYELENINRTIKISDLALATQGL